MLLHNSHVVGKKELEIEWLRNKDTVAEVVSLYEKRVSIAMVKNKKMVLLVNYFG